MLFYLYFLGFVNLPNTWCVRVLTVTLGFQAWEQSAGVIVSPKIQLLASEVSKLLTKEIKRNLNGKPAGNDPIPYPLDPVILEMWIFQLYCVLEVKVEQENALCSSQTL